MADKRIVRAPRGAQLNCKSWLSEAPYRMIQNNLEPEDVYERGHDLAFPQGVVDFFKGMIGQPYGGFPEKLQKKNVWKRPD